MLSLTYGITPTDFEHPFIKTPEEFVSILNRVVRGDYWGHIHFFGPDQP